MRGMGTAAVRRTSRRGTCVKRYGPRSTLKDDDAMTKSSPTGEAPANVSAYKNRLASLPSRITQNHFSESRGGPDDVPTTYSVPTEGHVG